MIWANKKAVCITGGGFGNKGAEAMVLTIANAIRKRLPDVKIFIRVKSIDFSKACNNNLFPIKSDNPTSISSRLFSKIRTANLYYKCSAFINVGGYQIGDPWEERLAQKLAKTMKRCVRFGNQVFLMPQAWGPFSSRGIADAVWSIIQTATLSYVRDKRSMEAVEKVVGKENPKVRFAHDIAWNFQGADLMVGRRLIHDAGLLERGNSITVCVTPNLRFGIFEGTGQENKYIKSLRCIIQYLCSKHNAKVLLLGHAFESNNLGTKDDRTLCNYLLSSFEQRLPVAHLDRILTAAKVKSVIGNCDLLISSRYHALIAALSQGIPAAAIGWSHKYDELMAEVGLTSNIISLSKTNKEIFMGIDSIVESLAGMRNIIAPKVLAMKKSGQEAVNEVVSRIEYIFQG